ncbi:MAG: carboxylating nicotinate-nucleotide diphosphorylase [Candidatus Thermoplasmatota archaeon]|jgi:nicotinate-nucleotide pyrophosphorylase (carboxylating)|nr:carboxylating nicotinate-nucleotide diphosphorylase [Candidatus Thermoplasmatota archaeon]
MDDIDDIDRFLKEDLGEEGDITSDSLFTDETAYAEIIAKEDCVVAGLEEAKKVFQKTGAEATLALDDGVFVKKGTAVAKIRGPVRSILKGERLALNMIGRMSGIATETKTLVDLCRKINPNVTIAATRKTTPGFRKYEKKAVVIGGGEPHRFGLYDAVMIKDNHLRVVGSVEKAIKKVKEKIKNKVVEVEVENEEDALVAAKMNVDVIMLDNFDAKSGKVVAEKIRRVNPDVLIEVSGGITRGNIERYASFADRISLGYLTHSIRSRDFSLEIRIFPSVIK